MAYTVEPRGVQNTPTKRVALNKKKPPQLKKLTREEVLVLWAFTNPRAKYEAYRGKVLGIGTPELQRVILDELKEKLWEGSILRILQRLKDQMLVFQDSARCHLWNINAHGTEALSVAKEVSPEFFSLKQELTKKAS